MVNSWNPSILATALKKYDIVIKNTMMKEKRSNYNLVASSPSLHIALSLAVMILINSANTILRSASPCALFLTGCFFQLALLVEY